MKTKLKALNSFLAVILALVIIPFSTANALTPSVEPSDSSVNVSDRLTDFNATLTQDGNVLGDSDKIDSEKALSVAISFGVPVQTTVPTPPQPVQHGDMARFEVSDQFSILTGVTNKLLSFNGTDVGHISLVMGTDEGEEGKVFANVVFDGATSVFDGTDLTLTGVTCQFTANLKYDKTGDDGEAKDVDVAILNKTYTVHVPDAPIVYTVTKDGTADLANKKINWKVDVTATKAGNSVDLTGYQFADNLSGVGTYVPDSLEVGTAFVSPDGGGDISYTFPAGSTSPQTVHFSTAIPDGKYYVSGSKSISNTAVLRNTADTQVATGSKTVAFTPPTWITKTGSTNDTTSGNYSSTGRTISWTITANQVGAAMNGVVITDVLPSGLTWQSATWSEKDSLGSWVPKGFITPDAGHYSLGDITGEVQLTIVTTVPDAASTTTSTTYTNSASIAWKDASGTERGPVSATAPGVTIGYNTITKTGTPHPKDRTVTWMVNVDARGQSSLYNLKVYDLLVYGSSGFDLSKIDADASLPAGFTKANFSNIRYNEKYNGNFKNNGPSPVLAPTVTTIYKDGVAVADLLVFNGLSYTQVNSFSFDTLVLNPDIFAGNSTKKIYNTTMLFNDDTKLAEATAGPDYNSHVLAKDMLQRGAANLPTAPDANKYTSTPTDGFDYTDKSVIFRLRINADGLNLSGSTYDAAGRTLGAATVTDKLPAGWEFVPFAPGADYLIYSANATTNGNLTATGLPLTLDSSVMNAVFDRTSSQQTVAFTFNGLNQPYVILVKAKPTDATIATYFAGNGSFTITNTASLNAIHWTPGVSTTQDVKVTSTVFSKGYGTPNNGALQWTVDYQPYNLSYADTRKIQDTLPTGLDLPLDSSGNLLVSGNIAVNERTLKPDGTYQLGTSVPLTAGQNIFYDNATRTLRFVIPDNSKAYELTYLTYLTGSPGSVSNSAKLVSSTTTAIPALKFYLITDADASATLLRSGYVAIKKTDGTGAALADAGFTLYASDGTTVIRQGTTAHDGSLLLKMIPDGTYYLKETTAPAGYTLEGVTHTVVVTTVGSAVTTKIDGNVVTNTQPLGIRDFFSDTVGGLTIRKTVAGTANENRSFDFTVTFWNADDTPNNDAYQYTDKDGTLIGTISSGGNFSLKNNEFITINGLIKGLKYTVAEDDYSSEGYTTVSTGETGKIVEDAIQTVVFTNTKNKPGSLTISKTVMGNAKEAGKKFEFTVTLNDTVNTHTYTGVNGGPSGSIKGSSAIKLEDGQSVTIADLLEGTTYTVTEKNYSGDGYTTVSIGAVGQISTNVTKTAAFTNTRNIKSGGGGTPVTSYGVTITKTDEAGKPLAGAEFTLYNSKGEAIAKAFSNNQGAAAFDNLAEGAYTARETKAPEGYEINTAVLNITVNDTTTNAFTVVDKVKSTLTGTVQIKKTDESGHVLAGAVFTLYDAKGAVVKNVTTDANGLAVFKNIPQGDYSLYETHVPEGYAAESNGGAAIAVKYGQTTALTIQNKKIVVNDGLIQIKKSDVEGNALSGAEFTLYDSHGKVLQKLISGLDGLVSFTGLKPGNYSVKETTAPKGYKLFNDPLEITLKTGQTVSYTLRDTTIDEDDTVVLGWTDSGNLPKTGGIPITAIILAFGILLVLAGIYIQRHYRKRYESPTSTNKK